MSWTGQRNRRQRVLESFGTTLSLLALISCFVLSSSVVFVHGITITWRFPSLSSGSLITYNISCPDGWQRALNNCYLFNLKDKLTWSQARTECSLQNADLMVFRTRQEMEWITIQTEEYVTDGWWVGLHYGASWDWVQYGGDKTLINWRNEPDNYDEQDCCSINEFGLFSDEFCRSKLGFICKYPIQRGDLCPSGDNSNWYMTDTACYFVSPLLNDSLHFNWTTAKQYCANLMPDKGTQLMSLTTLGDARFMKYLLRTLNQGILLPWWTGLNDKQTEGQYRWVDGTLANGSIITWDVAPDTDRSKHKDCGIMYQGGTIDDVSCDKRAHYVCEMSAFQGHLNLGCGSWLRGGGSCYLLSRGKGYTWSESKDNCARANAQLLKVENADERAWVASLDIGPYGYWTGLSRADNQYGWAWQDNSMASDQYVQWSVEPNNNGGQENCVEIHRDGLYNDRMCTAKVGFICEYPLSYGGTCMGGWTGCNQTCYYISPANDSFAVTWYEAKQRCIDLGTSFRMKTYRLAVNDKREQACVNSLLQALPQGAPGYWTGLNDLQLRGLWQYDEVFNNPVNKDVIAWAKEPNNANNNESCAVIYNSGFYNDMNCEAKAYYICEKPVGASSVATSSARKATVLTSSVLIASCIYFIFLQLFLLKDIQI